MAVVLRIKTVFAFAGAGFGVNIKAGLRAHGSAHAHGKAGAAVFAVEMLLALAGFEHDILRGIKGELAAGFGIGVLQADIAGGGLQIQVAAGGQAVAQALSVALVLAVVGGFEAHAGFGFGNCAAARERIISLIAPCRCGHALQRPSAAFGLALGRTFHRVDQINQRGRHFGKATYFHIALGLVAAAKVAPGRDIDALGADIDISGGRHIGRLLGISAGGLDMHIAAEAADLRFELLDLAALVLGLEFTIQVQQDR